MTALITTRSRAPLRISLGGGGTDISPYPEEHHGAVLNITIDKYAYSTLVMRDDNAVAVRSLDLNAFLNHTIDQEMPYDGNLDLTKGTVKLLGIKTGFDLLMHCDSPPGSGLGSSSAMVVAMVGAFRHRLKLPLDNYNIAEIAYRIEREEVGIRGGRQDQYAAVFGGLNFIEFLGDAVVVNPLRINDDLVNELQYRCILCFTGQTRISTGIIDDQVTRYKARQNEMLSALHETKSLAYAIKNALLVGHINDVGDLLHQGWLSKKKFSDKISNVFIDELYEEARKNGAIGGKVLGAGGGGYCLFICEPEKKHRVIERLGKVGGKVIDFAFEFKGLQTWNANGHY